MKFDVIARIGFSLLLGLSLAAGSSVGVGTEASGSRLRLSWSLVGEQKTTTLSQAELEKLPVHMRPMDGVAESTPVPYRLRAELNGKPLWDEVVKPAGLRGDRPMYVLRELDLSPGVHRLGVTFEPAESIQDALVYRLDREIDFGKGKIVTIDLERGRAEMVVR